MKEEKPSVSLWEIFVTFFTIGATGFGGGMAIVAVIERRCVLEKKWVGHNEFLHGLAFGQLLGPFSLNCCTFIGSYLRGPVGGVLAATAFLAPSFLLISALSWIYFRFHQLPQLKAALAGSNPVVIALIAVAGIGMARKKVVGWESFLLAAGAFAATAFFGVSALAVLLAAGCFGLWKGWRSGRGC